MIENPTGTKKVQEPQRRACGKGGDRIGDVEAKNNVICADMEFYIGDL